MTPGLVLMRRAAWVKAGGFSESRIHRGHEDGAFWLRLALEGPIVYSPETLLSYRRHDAQETQRRDRSLTISQSRVQRLVDIKDAIYARNDSDLKRLLDEQILSAGVYAAWLSRRRGDWRGAVKCAMSAIGVRPFSLSAWRALLFSAMFAFRVS